MIGAKKKINKHAPLPANQMRTNTNRFMNSLFVVTSSSDWLLVKFFFTLIGCYDNFGLGFTTLKALRSPNMKTFGIHMSSNTKSSRSVFLFLLQFLNMLFCCPFCRLLICSLLKKRPESTKYSRRLPRM